MYAGERVSVSQDIVLCIFEKNTLLEDNDLQEKT